MSVKAVRTNLDPEFVSANLLKVYQRWIEFSLGIKQLGGHMLKTPSGKMASAMKAQTDPDGNIVALYVDAEDLGAASTDLLVTGHKGFSLKRKMLQAGKPGVKRSKAGYLYRQIPIASNPRAPGAIFGEAKRIVNLFTSKTTQDGGILQINRNLARMWVTNYKTAHGGPVKIRTMSNRPGAARWYIPSMKPFNAGQLLKNLTQNYEARSRILI